MSERKFTIYGAAYCSYCSVARKLLDEAGKAYEYIDITKDPEAMRMLVEREFKTVPQVFHGSEHIGGAEELKSYLEVSTDA